MSISINGYFQETINTINRPVFARPRERERPEAFINVVTVNMRFGKWNVRSTSYVWGRFAQDSRGRSLEI
jgi:hypothetical protein